MRKILTALLLLAVPVIGTAEIFSGPAPATFIIGTDGKVRFGYVNPDYTVRLTPEVLLAAARSYAEGKHRRFQRNRRG